MQTLFEKLKVETLESLEQEALLYPYTVKKLIETLKVFEYWGQLSINDAYRLITLNQTYGKFDIETLSNLFNE